MKNTEGLKVGDIVIMTHDWARVGRPLNTKHKVIRIKDKYIIELSKDSQQTKGYYNGHFHVDFVEFVSHPKRNLKDFYEKY